MNKRKLAKIPKDEAAADMLDLAEQYKLRGIKHIVTAKLVDDKKILLLNFYKIGSLKKGNTGAAFRTFLSDTDYITQDLKVSNVKWLTASFDMMDRDIFNLIKSDWNEKKHNFDHTLLVGIRSDDEMKLINEFFKDYARDDDEYAPWTAIYRFQEKVKENRLDTKHRKVTDKIDSVMKPIKDAPKEFFDWVWENGMRFSRYLIYRETRKGKAECECTHCKKIGIVDRKDIRLRNNEKGSCPFCGSSVTFKARGKMPAQIFDKRWFLYVDPTQDGFVFRYFKAIRIIRNDSYIDMLINKDRIEQYADEYRRAIYTFPDGKPKYVSYEWGVYKQRGKSRWCPDIGKIDCMDCILYPDNLPKAWEHTPMKYSALEVLSSNMNTVGLRYEDAIKLYMDFPKLEWICKMGLNNLARDIISDHGYSSLVGKINYKGKSIYDILGLTKVNARVLQDIDGNNYVLRLLQVSQKIGIQFNPEQLLEYYETFECNTDLLMQANQKVSLHKLLKYITKESENYPIGDRGCCLKYSYMQYKERKDPRVDRKKNMAADWLEYLKWCKDMKYDLDNMFIYMPKNFKKVHDRTYREYQTFIDKKQTEKNKQLEALVKKNMECIKNELQILFNNNDIFCKKGLMIVVPKDAIDIKAEGHALHHCVGTYVQRVARGETNIFFIRMKSNPEFPYYTMEINMNGNMVQCRGKNNCNMTTEVKAFAEEFASIVGPYFMEKEKNRRKVS